MDQNIFDFVTAGKRNRGGLVKKLASVLNVSKKPSQNLSEKVFDNVNPYLKSTDSAEDSSPKTPSAKNSPIFSYVILFSFLIIFSLFLFIFRAFSLQVLKSSEYNLLSQKNRTRSYEVPAPRGVIYDRNGKVIAQNQPNFNLVLNLPLCSIGEDTSLCERIVNEVFVELLLEEKSEILKEIKEGQKESIVIAKNLKKDQILAIEGRGYPAVDILSFPSRDYLYSNEFAHLIGYTGLSSKSISPVIEGKTGIEAFYDDSLKGVSGKRLVQVNSRNENIAEFDTQDPVSGKNISLFADIGLQRLSYELLRETVDGIPVSFYDDVEVEKAQEYIEGFSKKANAGVVVAQDPQTGGILALVSYPSFDAQKMVSGVTAKELQEMEALGPFPFFNRAIGASYAPGSTFKLVMASAILEEKIATPTQTIFDPGYIEVAGYTFKNWKLDGHGLVDLLRALQVSNDPYFYIMGGGYDGIRGLGIDRINKWSKKFGFGTKTGIDLFGEVTGFVPDSSYKDWYLGDTYITSIGQGDFLATPLQVNLMTSYFANGEELLSPRVVKSIEEKETKREVLAKDLVFLTTLATVREGVLRAASPGGTGYPVYDFAQKHNGVVVAGKTGTSEYIDSKGEYGTHAMFTAWAPYEDAEIVLTVFLEGGGSGAHDAAPIARKLLDYWFEQ